MKTNCLNGFAALVLFAVMMALPAVSGGIDKQVPIARSAALTKTDLPGKSTMLARNTSAKTESIATAAAPAKTQKAHDKKAVGRCWSRLMGMFREINIAHRNRTK